MLCIKAALPDSEARNQFSFKSITYFPAMVVTHKFIHSFCEELGP